MATKLQTLDYEALATFRYNLRKFLRVSKEFLTTTAKLTPEQYEALLALKIFASDDGMLVGQLSERLQVKHHTAVALTKRLVAGKLITKQRGRADRRHVYVKLTETGSALLEVLAAVHRDAIRVHSSEMIKALTHLQKA